MSSCYVCEAQMCVGCMACADVCPQKAITVNDSTKYYNAQIDRAKCIDCGVCHSICQVNNKLHANKPHSWYQGWHVDVLDRATSTSGGVASALAEAFIDKGGVVYSCVFRNGQFVYSQACEQNEIKQFKGSKYVKSNPKGVYESIKESLKHKDVLFIGLPCHVAAVNKYLSGKKFKHIIYTCDVICHGTPSPKLLDSFLKQYNIDLGRVKDIKFRDKKGYNLQCDGKYILHEHVRDLYTLAFLKGLSFTENCYKCQYAGIERVSDITVGDSWGSQLDEEEISKGISLILCQTQLGEQLVKQSRLELREVDIDHAIESNHQLREPMADSVEHRRFFSAIQKGRSFNYSVFKCYPKDFIKQRIKRYLIKIDAFGSRFND